MGPDSATFELFGNVVSFGDSCADATWEVEEGVNVVASGLRMLFDAEGVLVGAVSEEFKILESGMPLIVVSEVMLRVGAPQPGNVEEGIRHFIENFCLCSNWVLNKH